MSHLEAQPERNVTRYCQEPRYFRRDGTAYPIGDTGLYEWARDMTKVELRRVRCSRSIFGEVVSTVWLGIIHAYAGGPPLIFETMVFPAMSSAERICLRYSTEEQALQGHWRTWLQTFIPPRLRARWFAAWR